MLKNSSDQLERLGIKSVISGLQGAWFIHYTITAPHLIWYSISMKFSIKLNFNIPWSLRQANVRYATGLKFPLLLFLLLPIKQYIWIPARQLYKLPTSHLFIQKYGNINFGLNSFFELPGFKWASTGENLSLGFQTK